MKVTNENLNNLKSKYTDYLEGDIIEEFFDEFEISFAAGHWCAGDFADRFAPAGYNSDNPQFRSDIVAQIERVAKAKIKGIELHEALFIDKNFKKDLSKIEEAKRALEKNKVVPTNMNTNLFSHPKWKLGGVTNVNEIIRQKAIETALQGIEIAKEIGCLSFSLWPGSDGWDYNFEVNYGKQLDKFIEACILINKKAKSLGLKFGIEAKLHEPREGNIIIPTSHLTILVAKIVNEECSGDNMGVVIDYGHEQMYAVEPASLLYTAKRAAVPVVNFHLNNAKLHSNDEDRIAETGDIWRLTDFCYAAIDTQYNGWFGEDQFTYRTEPIKSMALSKEFFANIMKKALLIYTKKDELEKAQATGDALATIEVVKKILI